MNRETEEYLAKIKKTIADSKLMIESVKLRFAETDRLLADSGTSREEVKKFSFTREQCAVVNEELARRGLPPLEPISPECACEAAAAASPCADAADMHEDMENRRRKFGVMMKQFRM